MAVKRRRLLFVDRKLQGALLAHTTLYWFYCLLSVSLVGACWITLTTSASSTTDLLDRLWIVIGPVLLGSVVLLPLVLMDCLRLSNRLAGPMVRIQRAMEQAAAGQRPDSITFREKDFWKEFSVHLNQVIERMEEAGLFEAERPDAASTEPADAPSHEQAV